MLRTFDDEDYNRSTDWLEEAGLPIEILEPPTVSIELTSQHAAVLLASMPALMDLARHNPELNDALTDLQLQIEGDT